MPTVRQSEAVVNPLQRAGLFLCGNFDCLPLLICVRYATGYKSFP